MGCVRFVAVQLSYLSFLSACATQLFPGLTYFVDPEGACLTVLGAVWGLAAFFLGMVFNWVGMKPITFGGSMAMAMGGTMIYLGETQPNVVLQVLGGAVTGLGAAGIQTCLGIAALWYPQPGRRGHVCGLINLMSGLVRVVLSGISMLLNGRNGLVLNTANVITCFILLALTGCSELFLLDVPDKVIRYDYSNVPYESTAVTSGSFVRVFTTLQVDFFVLPLWVSTGMILRFAYFVTRYMMTPRTSACVDAMLAVGVAAGGGAFMSFMDSPRWSPRKRGQVGFMLLCSAAAVAGGICVVPHFSSCGEMWYMHLSTDTSITVETTTSPLDKCYIDITETSFLKFTLLAPFSGFAMGLVVSYTLWILSFFMKDDKRMWGHCGGHLSSAMGFGFLLCQLLQLHVTAGTTIYVIAAVTTLGCCFLPIGFKKLSKSKDRSVEVELERSQTKTTV
ncbi:MAG: uncharacterized protein KVP18_000616 [Porospora cf. gigantea A]|uniref:uncharacterized protein n=1 Tax=Porospora cf. gigantea A TaxID=2853593 RepID=UPI003559CBDD|nr:MAG: hypothetical protein KVP18_000616 [Porospora cf. gigantea A]